MAWQPLTFQEILKTNELKIDGNKDIRLFS